MEKNGSKGFTLIELLIAVAIIGVLAGIVIPLLLESIQRSKQKRTMADMRSLSIGLESYAVDHSKYPNDYTYVQPYFIHVIPKLDAWGRPWVYDYFDDGNGFSLSSGGRDGGGHATILDQTHSFDDSITIVNGQFVAYPDGIQT